MMDPALRHWCECTFCQERADEITGLRAQLASAIAALEQAQDCIRGETPEDMTDEEAREDTISKIRAIILTDERGTP